MLTFALVPLALAASALANVFIINPTSTTTFTAGQQANITWQDDGNAPSLPQFGKASFAIYVGNANQQTPLQMIVASVDVSSTTSVTFTPDASIGPVSNEYFVRVTSLSFKDPNQPQYFAEAFSAKFNMVGMKGSFNSSIQAEINGQSTAPIGAPTMSSSPSATSTSGSGNGMTTMAGMTGSMSMPMSTGTSTSTASPTGSTNGAAKPVMATGIITLIATLVGAAFF